LRGRNSFYENVSFGSHADRFFREAWAVGCQEKCPRLAATDVAITLAVATPAIFVCGGKLEIGDSLEPD
jgi:hypothetical protein